jgi:hypothetical protein
MKAQPKRTTNGNYNLGAALFVAKSGNSKIASARGKGEVSTTYVSIEASCPTTCKLRKDKTCYAENGHVGMQVRRIEGRSQGSGPNDAADDEANVIDASFKRGPIPQDGVKGGRDLRLHTSGDCRTCTAALKVGHAAERWKARGGGRVWTYTHAWNVVHRDVWGPAVSVLASLDFTSFETVQNARSKGYAPARIVPEHKSPKAFVEFNTQWIPCPAQTQENVGCADCGLCLNADALFKRQAGIVFAAHGARASTLKRRLTVVS